MSAPIDVPQPPATNSSSSSSPSGSPLALDPSTLALLGQFYQEKEQAEQEFRALEEKAHERLMRAKEQDQDEKPQLQSEGKEGEEDKMMTVDQFRKLFQEDWQLSQFW